VELCLHSPIRVTKMYFHGRRSLDTNEPGAAHATSFHTSLHLEGMKIFDCQLEQCGMVSVYTPAVFEVCEIIKKTDFIEQSPC